MKEENIFLTVKASVAAACAGFGAAFGWQGWLVLTFAVCMLGDYLSGTAAACRNGQWSSAAARLGLWHKAGMMFAVGAAGVADCMVAVTMDNLPMIKLPFPYGGLLFPMALCWYSLTELGSILENAQKLGAPLPDFLQRVLAAANGTENETEA